MNMAISVGFDDEAEYRRVTEYLRRYTRNKLVNERVWDFEKCTEKANDMVTDAVLKYIKKAEEKKIDAKIGYIRVIIDKMLISRKFIKEKAIEKEKIIVFNSSDENIEKASFSIWEKNEKIIIEEHIENYSQDFFNIPRKIDDKYSDTEKKLIELKNEGLANRLVSLKLNISESYICKLVKKLRPNFSHKNWK